MDFNITEDTQNDPSTHDDVIKWKHFPRYWPFVRGSDRSPVNSTHKDQWRGALIFSLICAWLNGWVNNREAGDLRHHRAHYDVTVMVKKESYSSCSCVHLFVQISPYQWWAKGISCNYITRPVKFITPIISYRLLPRKQIDSCWFTPTYETQPQTPIIHLVATD